MKAQDLRIESIVDCLGLCYVTKIGKNKITIKRPIGDGQVEIEKVPLQSSLLTSFVLTEEWIKSFGFDDLGEYGYGIGQFHVVNRVGKWGFPIEDKIRFIKYVHELQNIYHALTGNELKYVDG